MRFLVPCLLLLCFSSSCFGRYWEWTKGADYHRAAVIVQDSQTGDTGSGIYITYRGLNGVLTASHILSSSMAKVTFQDGKIDYAQYSADKYENDLAFIFLENKNITPIQVSQNSIKVGETVEFLTKGGYQNSLRHFPGKVIQVLPDEFRVDAAVLGGDSGGGILINGKLIGIQSTGGAIINYYETSTQRFPIFQNAGCVHPTPIRNFLSRIFDRYGGCQDGSCESIPGAEIYPAQEYYYAEPDPLPPLPDVIPVIPPSVQIEQEIIVDYNIISDLIYEKMKEDSIRWRGEKGDPGINGKDGSDGVDGKDGKDATIDYDLATIEVLKRLPPIEVVFMGEGGKVDRIEQVNYGEQIVIPAQRWEIQKQDGKVLFQEKALGKTIAFKLVE